MCAPYVEARPKGSARAEKKIGEKAQKIIRYQIVSTYFSTRCVQSIVLRAITEHPEDFRTLYVVRV